jgi:hypothetical protein
LGFAAGPAGKRDAGTGIAAARITAGRVAAWGIAAARGIYLAGGSAYG